MRVQVAPISPGQYWSRILLPDEVVLKGTLNLEPLTLVGAGGAGGKDT